MAFTGELYKTFKEEETPSPRENFHDLGDWGHFPAEEATASIPKPDRLVTRKEKYRPAPLVNTSAELRGKMQPVETSNVEKWKWVTTKSGLFQEYKVGLIFWNQCNSAGETGRTTW